MCPPHTLIVPRLDKTVTLYSSIIVMFWCEYTQIAVSKITLHGLQMNTTEKLNLSIKHSSSCNKQQKLDQNVQINLLKYYLFGLLTLNCRFFNLPIIKVTLAALLASLFVLKSRNQQFGSHSFPLALRSQSRTPLGISIKPTILTTIVFEQGIKG